jgi:hypothetical protein
MVGHVRESESMIEFLFAWACVVLIVALACQSIDRAIRQYYDDRRQCRLERIDQQLQRGREPTLIEEEQSEQLIDGVVSFTTEFSTPQIFARNVLDYLAKHHKISQSQADNIMR